ncbi:ABC transporter permease [Pseudarthrobacter sp. IC2-21]|uniref:ABC transporter permease n=1 Tax=Pseudarthrobacter sp. IC2-21 TaxID=3092262 RepID=UPI002A6A40FF|nr:ABC transporter permease [Pseudarthrobacter sp. IC2-21]
MTLNQIKSPPEERFGNRVESQPSGSVWQRMGSKQWTPVVIATVLVFVASAIIAPRSLLQASLLAMIVPTAVLAVAAIGQTLVVQQKGIDLAAPGYITLAATITVFAPERLGTSGAVSVGLALVVSILAGLLNGFFIAKLNVTPIISSLALNSLLLGGMWTVSAGSAFNAPSELTWFAKNSLLGLPLIVWLAVLLVAATAIFMSKSSTGRRFVGVGANPSTARATGVKVDRYIAGSYVASGFFAGLAGVLLVAYLGKSSISIGTPYLFPIITAVIVGGAVLSGGRGSVVSSAIAALFLSQVVQMVLTLGAPESVRLLVNAIAIAIASTVRVVPWGNVFRRKNKTGTN